MTQRTVITIANITADEVEYLNNAQQQSDELGYNFGIRTSDLTDEGRELLRTGFIRRRRITGHRGQSVDGGAYILTSHGAKWWNIIRHNHPAAA